MFANSHCHLQLIDYQRLGLSQDEVVAAAIAAGVEHMLCVATHPRQETELFELSKKYPIVAISLGLHPNEVIEQEPTLANYLASFERAQSAGVALVAVGETGLDYFRTTENLEQQRDRFRTQIQLAKQFKKPLIIHTREAKEDTLRILEEEGAGEVGGVIHCFTENWEWAQKFVALNFHISFSGIVTFKQAQELQQVAKKLPLERMLIETDCPYLAPIPHRGEINQPAYVAWVAKFIAELRGISVEAVAEATTINYHRVFNI